MTIYLKDGSIENCLSDEHKSEFWEDLIERRLGRDALNFYQNEIQLNEANRLLTEISQQIDKVIY